MSGGSRHNPSTIYLHPAKSALLHRFIPDFGALHQLLKLPAYHRFISLDLGRIVRKTISASPTASRLYIYDAKRSTTSLPLSFPYSLHPSNLNMPSKAITAATTQSVIFSFSLLHHLALTYAWLVTESFLQFRIQYASISAYLITAMNDLSRGSITSHYSSLVVRLRAHPTPGNSLYLGAKIPSFNYPLYILSLCSVGQCSIPPRRSGQIAYKGLHNLIFK